MAVTQTKIRTDADKGYLDYSVTFDSAYAATNGEALTFGSNTNFTDRIDGVVVLRQPTGWFVNPTYGASVTSVRLRLYGSASTTSGRTEVAFLQPTTGYDAHALKCRIRVFGG